MHQCLGGPKNEVKMLNQQVFFLEDTHHRAKPKISILLPPTNVAARQNIFVESMLEKSSTRQKRHPLKWVVSLGAHVAVLTLLLLIPLYFSQGLNLRRLNMTLLGAPLPPAAAVPPPPATAVTRAVRKIPKTFTPGKFTVPSFVPKVFAATPDAAPPEEALGGMPGGVSGGIPGGQIGGILGGEMGGVTVPAAPAAVPERPKGPVRVGGNVRPPRLLSGPAPIYPILAQQSRLHGMVVIEAIIDERGNVIQEKVISGHPLLVPAAMKAVSQRKYEPTILDGEPTQVDLRVEVNFQLE
jgi:periplasmic protein TonB